MSEDKMRESFSTWWDEHGQFCRAGGGQYEETFAYEAWKACAAIKDAEIGDLQHLLSEMRKLYIEAQKEIAALNLTIKDLQESAVKAMSDIRDNQCNDALSTLNEAIAKSEHHNSRALEKMLLEARIDEIELEKANVLNGGQPWYMRLQDLRYQLDELNRE